MTKIYHNPRCSKSRQTLQLLRDHGTDPQVIEYLKTPPSTAELKRIIKLLGISAAELVRNKDKTFRQLCPDGDLTDAAAIQLLTDHPELMERPVVVTDADAVIGRPPENALSLLAE